MLTLSRNVLLLLFLYFIQGLPYGFQSQFLPLHLRAIGHDLTNVGLMRLLHAPWLCKALWSPLVDTYGTKRKWLLASLSGLVFSCLLGAFVSTNNILFLCIVLFLLNLFASTQDIAVDGIAVALLGTHELASGNTAQVVGYKIGSIFGGGVLIWFMDQLGWTGLFMALTVLYVEAFMFVYVSPSLRYLESKLKEFSDANQRISDWQNMSKDYMGEAPEWEDYNVENEETDANETRESVPGEEKDSQTKDLQHDASNETAEDVFSEQNQIGNLINIIDDETRTDKESEINQSIAEPTTDAQNKDLFPDQSENTSLSTEQDQNNETNQNDENASDENISEEDDDDTILEDSYNTEKSKQISILKAVLDVPGTKWMITFVLIYKLGMTIIYNIRIIFVSFKSDSNNEI